MKGALIALLIGISLLLFLYLKLDIYRGKTSFDIHLHDTYFQVDYVSAIVLVLISLGTFFSIGGVIGTHLRNKSFWILMVLFLSIDTYFVVKFYKAYKETEVTEFPII